MTLPISTLTTAFGDRKQNGPTNSKVLLETRRPVCRFHQLFSPMVLMFSEGCRSDFDHRQVIGRAYCRLGVRLVELPPSAETR